jgi:hypothetical protein
MARRHGSRGKDGITTDEDTPGRLDEFRRRCYSILFEAGTLAKGGGGLGRSIRRRSVFSQRGTSLSRVILIAFVLFGIGAALVGLALAFAFGTSPKRAAILPLFGVLAIAALVVAATLARSIQGLRR